MTALRALLNACLLWAFAVLPGQADEAVVAVSANFLTTAETLAEGFQEETGHEITLAHGSTGRLYAQIVHGAPFDLFLSADADRPRRLAEAGLAVDVRPYAVGRLALLSSRADPDLPGDLKGARIAIANARIAPYGAAAEEVLARWGIGPGEATVLRGDSVGQAVGLFATGNADFALVSVAQADASGAAHVTPVAETDHAPIVQDAALLRRGAENPAARAFLEYVTGAAARAVIAGDGYDLPEPPTAAAPAGAVSQ